MNQCKVTHRDWLFNPGVEINPTATDVHGISDEDVKGCPAFRDHAVEIRQLTIGADFAGYSLRGDLAILEKEFTACHIGFDISGSELIDAYRLWCIRKPRTLADAYKEFVNRELPQIEGEKLHDATYDATITHSVIMAMTGSNLSPAESSEVSTVNELHKECFPDMVDSAGKFKRGQDGVIRFAFGKFNGEPVAAHHDYLQWMLSKDFPGDTRRHAERLLANCHQVEDREPPPADDYLPEDDIPF